MSEQLTEIFSEIEALMGNNRFQRELAQVRARALQEEIASSQQLPDFSFDPKRVWRYCEYIFSEGSLLIREGFTEDLRLLEWIRKIAETFEFLARFENADDRKTLLINSALCYDIAGYHANAQCICRMIDNRKESIPSDTDSSLVMFFEQTLIALIQRKIRRLRGVTSAASRYIQEAQTSIAQSIAEGVKTISDAISITAHAYFHRSISEFLEYCVLGERVLYESALTSMQKSHRYFQQCQEVSFSVIVSEIRTIYTLFEDRSTWENLKKYIPHLLDSPPWQSYVRSLAIEKSIVEFWNSQLRALDGGLLSTSDSFVVQMPTSAGKTFIAELSMLPSLIDNRARCLYIAPYRALVNEIETKLSETLNIIGLRVSNLMGGFEFDAFQNFLIRESDVLVATPEKVDLFLRTHPEYFQHIETIIVDEGHIIDEGVPSEEELGPDETLISYFKKAGTVGRGVLLELLITRLKRRLPQARVIFISAVMPDINAADFVQWLSDRGTEPLRISTEERPSRQTIASFSWYPSTNNGQLEYVSLPVLPDGRHPFVPYFLKSERYYTGELTPTRQRKQTTYPNTKNKVQATALLAVKYSGN